MSVQTPTDVKRPWTEDELAFIQDHSDWSNRQIAMGIGRTRKAVEEKRRSLERGWSREREPWSDAEEQVLIEIAGTATARQLQEHLPGRSIDSIKRRRVLLGITTPVGAGLDPTSIGARALLAKTCTTCGKLLQADWFSFRPTLRAWNSSCRVCLSARNGPDRKSAPAKRKHSGSRLQSITLDRATRRGLSWTEADHKTLADPDLSNMQKALQLGRTYFATRQACRVNGYKSHYGLGEPEDLWRIFNPNEVAA